MVEQHTCRALKDLPCVGAGEGHEHHEAVGDELHVSGSLGLQGDMRTQKNLRVVRML